MITIRGPNPVIVLSDWGKSQKNSQLVPQPRLKSGLFGIRPHVRIVTCWANAHCRSCKQYFTLSRVVQYLKFWGQRLSSRMWRRVARWKFTGFSERKVLPPPSGIQRTSNMQQARSSETSMKIYQTIRFNKPEGSVLSQYCWTFSAASVTCIVIASQQ
jgi:hypothetical protein